MKPVDVIDILRAHEAALCSQGVTRAALFGSAARGEAKAGSDIDIMVELDPAARIDIYRYVGITQYIAGLFSAPVDVSNRAKLVDAVRQTSDHDAIYAF